VDGTDQSLVAYALEEWKISRSASSAIDYLPHVDPSEYMRLLPTDMKAALSNYEFVRTPPATLDDFWYAESSLYSAKFFEGLTEAQAEEKIREAKLRSKQKEYDRFWALHEYFKGTA
jgi:hypothetical protein